MPRYPTNQRLRKPVHVKHPVSSKEEASRTEEPISKLSLKRLGCLKSVAMPAYAKIPNLIEPIHAQASQKPEAEIPRFPKTIPTQWNCFYTRQMFRSEVCPGNHSRKRRSWMSVVVRFKELWAGLITISASRLGRPGLIGTYQKSVWNRPRSCWRGT
jgi:hypothetical protein